MDAQDKEQDQEKTITNPDQHSFTVQLQSEKERISVHHDPTNRFLKHKPMTYGKKFYWGEFFAERLIQITAFLSIGFILAIFYYVFQESTYAFRSPENGTNQFSQSSTLLKNNSGQSSSKDIKQDSYSADESLRQDSYTSDQSLIQESYESETAPDKNKQSLDRGRESSKSMESAGSSEKITISGLITPNDTIDGKTRYVWQPIGTVPKYSFIPLFYGALKVTLIGLCIAAPLAILAAMFMSAFAPKWMREIMKPAIEILAGFPSIVIGFFCLMTLATVVQKITGSSFRLNSFVGGIGMALAVIPIIFTVTEDAFTAVPKFMKEASLALGASKWQTVYRVILPAATPGVFAAMILGFGRAFGETMIALMATGNAALVSMDVFESVRTMAATIGAEMAEVEFHSVHYGVLFLIGAVLFTVTFTLNAVAEFYVRKKLLKKFQGK